MCVVIHSCVGHDSIACLAEIGVWRCFFRALSFALSLSLYLSHVTMLPTTSLSLFLYCFYSPSMAYLSLTCMWCYVHGMNASCRIHESVTSHTRIRHVTHTHESCRAFLAFSLLHARALSLARACSLSLSFHLRSTRSLSCLPRRQPSGTLP